MINGRAAGIMAAALATFYAGRVMPEQKMRRLAGAALDPSKISWWLVALAIAMLAVFTYFVRQWFNTQAAAQ